MPNDATSPKHYSRLEPQPIDVIARWELDFNLGNVVKYIARAGHKPGVDAAEDLAKARTYLDHAIGVAREGVPGVPVDLELELAVVNEQLAAARAEVERWKITARCVADRLREVTGGLPVDAEKDRALELFAASCTFDRTAANNPCTLPGLIVTTGATVEQQASAAIVIDPRTGDIVKNRYGKTTPTEF
jgi:hypothetical protein